MFTIACLLLAFANHTEQPILAANPLPPPDTIVALSTGGSQSAASRYDFGSLSGLHSPPLSHTFVLQNRAPFPLALIELRPACGCTSALLGEKAKLPLTLPPGQQVSVRVTLDPVNLPPGPVAKAVWVYVKGQDAPAATLEMTGTLLPAARFSPAALDFGHQAFGKNPTLPLTVTWNSDALPTGSQCRLVSTNPEVTIMPEASSAEPSEPQAQTYQCTLSPQAHLGELRGSVEAIVTVPGIGQVVVGTAVLRGDISGDVAASPAVVAFGTVSFGQAATRQIMLTLAQPVMPAISSASPYLTARLHPMFTAQKDHPFGTRSLGSNPAYADAKPSTSSQALMDVTLSGKAPLGPLETELTVMTRNGQHLRVPVFAVIVPVEAK